MERGKIEKRISFSKTSTSIMSAMFVSNRKSWRKLQKQTTSPNKSNIKYDRTMKKIKASREEIDQFIKEAFNMNRQESNERTDRKSLAYYLGEKDEMEEQPPQAKAPSKEIDCQEVIGSELSEPTLHTENATVQRRISAKMRKGTLEAYKQAFLVPTKLNDRKAVYLSRATQERADFIVRRLGDKGVNVSSFIENLVCTHLEEYGEDIEKWRKL